MNDAAAVGFFEGVRDFDGDFYGFISGERLVCEASVERLAFEVLHDEEVDSILRADVVKDADVRMLQAGNGFGFAIETGAEFGVCAEMRRENFDGDDALETSVAGFVDFSHAAGAHGGLDFIGP